jgi:hypothetical protein
MLEIMMGVAIAFCLFASYADETHESRLVIWYLLTPKVLQIIAWIVLVILAGRLIYGKYNDYSNFFYNVFTRIFGDPKKRENKIE